MRAHNQQMLQRPQAQSPSECFSGLQYFTLSTQYLDPISRSVNFETKEKVIEYVVLHEMCHLREMNHSKKFWDLVEENMKDYKVYKKKLKDN